MVRDSSAALSAGNRNFTLPNTSGTFVVVNGINAITGATPDTGVRNPLTPVSRDYLDTSWNSSSGAALPRYFAMFNQTSILVGPWPDNSYTIEVIGTQRFTSLSSTNTSNFISTYLPDLLLAASMVFMAGYMKNFGSQSDNPQQAQSWETQYGKLMASAATEEARKKFAGSAWSSLSDGGPPCAAPKELING